MERASRDTLAACTLLIVLEKIVRRFFHEWLLRILRIIARSKVLVFEGRRRGLLKAIEDDNNN